MGMVWRTIQSEHVRGTDEACRGLANRNLSSPINQPIVSPIFTVCSTGCIARGYCAWLGPEALQPVH